MTTDDNTILDIATLPLADGRQVAVPLLALAEVQQYSGGSAGEEGLGCLQWRGHELPVQSLEEFCGLAPQPRENLVTVGIFRGREGGPEQFRALAFCGLAAHRQLNAADMQPVETPEEGNFTAAAMIGEQTYLIPDLPELLFA